MLFVPCLPGDEVCGDYTREQLLEMNDRFVAAVETAFEAGLESSAAAAATYSRSAMNGKRCAEAVIEAAWLWFVDAKFDVPAAAIMARCPGVSPERVRVAFKERFFSQVEVR